MTRDIVKYLFGKDLWRSRTGITAATSFLTLIWFVTDWCMTTTFRPMSDWMLWLCNLTAALLLTYPYILARRLWVQMAVLVIASLVMEANLMYCRTYFTAIPPESYLLAGNLGDFTASVWESLRWPDIGFPVIIATGWLAALRLPREQTTSLALRWTCLTLTGGAICTIGIMVRGGFHKAYDTLVQSCYYSTSGVPTYTIAGHIAYSLIDSGISMSPEATAKADAWLADHRRLTTLRPLPDSVGHRRSLVVIVCESLESWVIEKKVGGKEITPYLNSLLRDSTTLYAPNVLTQVASGRSIDFQLMLNTGLLPMKGSVYSMKCPGDDYPSLNKAMRERDDSRSVIFTCDKPITWNQAGVARAFGYDSLIDRRDWTIDEQIGNPPKLSDGSFLRQCAEKLKEGKIWPEGAPVFLTFITYSGHSPFRLPEDKKDPAFDTKGARLPERLDDYVNMAHYTDSQLHQLVDYVRSRPDYRDAMIIITGDHEALGADREPWIAAGGEAARLLSPEQLTPFIVLNSPVGGRYEKVMGQVDIYPTLLNLLGLEDYWWKGLGESIFQEGKTAWAISSMTLKETGSAEGAAPEKIEHLRKARDISDLMIRQNRFGKPAGGKGGAR